MLLPIIQIVFLWFCLTFCVGLLGWPNVYATRHYRVINRYLLLMLLKLVVILITGYFTINDLLNTTNIEAEVIAIKKTVTPSKIDLGPSPSLKIAFDEDILGDYQVAVRNTKTNKVVVLNNQNSLMRWKFNRKEIQLGLKKGEYYDILVHRKFGYKNILKIERLNQREK